MAQQLLERYRTEQGLVLIWILLLIGSIILRGEKKLSAQIKQLSTISLV